MVANKKIMRTLSCGNQRRALVDGYLYIVDTSVDDKPCCIKEIGVLGIVWVAGEPMNDLITQILTKARPLIDEFEEMQAPRSLKSDE
jgi:hypothetical protein